MINITPLKNSPRENCIDEIIADNCHIHIEKMNDSEFFLMITTKEKTKTFKIRGVSTIKQRPISVGIIED